MLECSTEGGTRIPERAETSKKGVDICSMAETGIPTRTYLVWAYQERQRRVFQVACWSTRHDFLGCSGMSKVVYYPEMEKK